MALLSPDELLDDPSYEPSNMTLYNYDLEVGLSSRLLSLSSRAMAGVMAHEVAHLLFRHGLDDGGSNYENED